MVISTAPSCLSCLFFPPAAALDQGIKAPSSPLLPLLFFFLFHLSLSHFTSIFSLLLSLVHQQSLIHCSAITIHTLSKSFILHFLSSSNNPTVVKMQFTRLANVLLGLALSVAAQPTNISKAPVILGNPPRLFEATLLDKDNTTLRGAVNIWAEAVGVKVHADFWGVPEETALCTLFS